MPRLRILLLWSLPVGCALIAGAAMRRHRLDLLDPKLDRWTFGDSASGGTSRAWTDTGSPWRLGHRLGPGFAFPYAAAGLHLLSGAGTIDLRDYDSLVVEWRSRRQRSLRIQIQGIEPGVTDTNRSVTFVPFEGALPIGPEWTRTSVALRDLSIPLWWNPMSGSPHGPHPGAFARARSLFLQNGMETPEGIDDTIEVRRLRLERTTWAPLWSFAAAALLLSGLLHLALFLRTRTRHADPAASTGIPVRDVALEPRRAEELRRLLEWTGSRYMDPTISVETAGRETGIHPRRIPSILRGAGRGTFPSVVNALRVDQARRLLRGTDRTVSEIAVAVGVPNVPHFHRLFKGATGRTPLEWRAEAEPVSAES